MNTFTRLLLATLAVAGLLLAAESYRPGWAAAVGLDLQELPELQRAIAREQRRAAALEEHGMGVMARINGKREVAVRLAAGRLGLREAAIRFRDLYAEAPQTLRYLRRSCDGASDDERLCRVVIAWAVGEVAVRSPEEARRLTARLEAELRDLRGPDGAVVLAR